MSYTIPEDVYQFLLDNPGVNGRELAEQCHLAGRTARRYRLYFARGEAVPGRPVQEVKVISDRMREYHAAQDTLSSRDFIERAPKMVRDAQARNPVITHDTFTFEVDHPVAIMFVSCIHLGGRYTMYEEFQEIFEQSLAIPHLYWVSLGDDMEGFIAQFKSVDAVYSQLIQVPDQLDILRDIVQEIVDLNKMLWACGSQHGDKWLRQSTGFDPVKRMYLDDFEVPFFDGVGFAKLEVGQQVYHVAFSHEFDGNSMWNPLQAQSKAARMRFPTADVVVMGDKHMPAMQLSTYFMDEYKMGLRENPDVWLLQAGTAKTGEDIYTVQRWPTGKLGWPIAVFFPDRHEVKCTLSIEDAKLWLNP